MKFGGCGRLLARVAAVGAVCGWKGNTRVGKAEVEEIQAWANTILSAAPVKWRTPTTGDLTTIYTDASEYGWGCCELRSGSFKMFGARWNDTERRRHRVERSAVSEPLAVRKSLRALADVIPKNGSSDIVVCTDHQPWSGRWREAQGWCRAAAYEEVARFLANFERNGIKITFRIPRCRIQLTRSPEGTTIALIARRGLATGKWDEKRKKERGVRAGAFLTS